MSDDGALLQRTVARSSAALDSAGSVAIETCKTVHPRLFGLVKFTSHVVGHSRGSLVFLTLPNRAVVFIVSEDSLLLSLFVQEMLGELSLILLDSLNTTTLALRLLLRNKEVKLLRKVYAG